MATQEFVDKLCSLIEQRKIYFAPWESGQYRCVLQNGDILIYDKDKQIIKYNSEKVILGDSQWGILFDKIIEYICEKDNKRNELAEQAILQCLKKNNLE